jgi:hypothetical protein
MSGTYPDRPIGAKLTFDNEERLAGWQNTPNGFQAR